MKLGRIKFSIMPGEVWIGTSGFSYRHWRKGVFYPSGLPQREELEYYAGRFRTVELNAPFYRLPAAEAFLSWKRRTPADFRFAVKVSRYVTHVRRLEDCAEPLATFLERVRGLGRKLGPMLFQLPPEFSVDLPRLETLLALLPRRRRFVLEVRHPSWLDEAVYSTLRRWKVALCVAVGGRLETGQVPASADFMYIRMHRGSGRGGGFSVEQLRHWAGVVSAHRDEGRDVYVYFNNDWGGHAVRDAAALRERLGVGR